MNHGARRNLSDQLMICTDLHKSKLNEFMVADHAIETFAETS